MTSPRPPIVIPSAVLFGSDDVDLAESARDALADRLLAVVPHLLSEPPPARGDDAASQVADLLEAHVRSLMRVPGDDRIWLLLTAVAAAYPTRTEVDRTRRKLQLLGERAAVLAVLDDTLAMAAEAGEPISSIDVVAGSVVVDVDHSAKYDLHTGIQRVSRSLMPLWTAQRGVTVAAWNAKFGGLRHLFPDEMARVIDWAGQTPEPEPGLRRLPQQNVATRLIVPWHSVVVLVEVPPSAVCDRLAAIGDKSGSRLVGVAHDAIPIVSADLVPSEDTSKFVRYLTAVKFASRMAGVSASAASEIAGFAAALPTQGLTGPKVVEVPLGAPRADPASLRSAPFRDASTSADTTLVGLPPTVLVVGSHEPRKNHLAVLHSAEILWREGRQFSLLFIGGSGWGEEFPHRAEELRAKGRPISVRRAVSEAELDKAYRSARFTLFPSLHEGFGLPVVESLARGTPVITSGYGSTAQSASSGGALLIDPRDDRSLTEAMRTLLTDDEILAKLRDEIANRSDRTWQDYADELWEQLVAPELKAAQDATL